MTTSLAEPEMRQRRFFCEHCERELFLNAVYCDHCGGKVEWPEKYASVFKEKKHGKQSGKEKPK